MGGKLRSPGTSPGLVKHLASVSTDPPSPYCRYLPLHLQRTDSPSSPTAGYLASATCSALVDSGNVWQNAISERLAQQLGYTSNQLAPMKEAQVSTAQSGGHLTVLGRLPHSIKLTVPGTSWSVLDQPAVLRGLTMDFNLSGPFLQRHSGIYDLKKGTLKLGRHELPLQEQPAGLSRRVRIRRNVSVAPWSGAHIEAVLDPPLEEGEVGQIAVLESFEEQHQLSGWRDVVVQVDKGSRGGLKVGVLNTLGRPVKLRAGTVYGTFAGVRILEDEVPLPEVAALSSPGPEGPEDKTLATDSQKREWLIKEFRLKASPFLRKPEEQEKAVRLLLRYWDVFSLHGEFGHTNLIQHEIHTVPGPPIKTRHRPINPALQEDLAQQIDEWESQDVIEPSQSQWNFALVAVKKKGTQRKRWCVDYRPLNAITLKDTFPIPNIEDNLARLANSRVFSGIDGCGAYHGVEIAPKDRPKTAFATPNQLYQFKRMPFGLTNAPATYCRLVQMVLAGIPSEMALPYLDDTCIHSPDLAGHFRALDKVLEAHRKAGLKLKPSKCHLFQDSIEYLGHVVSGDGLRPSPQYVRLVKEWPMPRTRTQVRAFLGKVGYYRRFIKGFSGLAAPWTDHSGKGTPEEERQEIQATPEMQRSFELLRDSLCKAPVLAYPRFQSAEPFILDTDWSAENAAIGGVLSQVQDGKERVIAYGGRKLNAAQKNYSPTKGELWAFLYFLKHWKYYLLHRRFLWRTDHAALTHIKSMDPPQGMVARWFDAISNFDFEVKYRPGPRHGNADGLSRAGHLPEETEDVPDETLICALLSYQ